MSAWKTVKTYVSLPFIFVGTMLSQNADYHGTYLHVDLFGKHWKRKVSA